MFVATSFVEPLRRPRESAQYVWINYTDRPAQAGIEPLVRPSDDNALPETVIGLYKTELIRRRRPRRSSEAVELATLE